MRNLNNFIKIGSWNIEGAYFKTNNYYLNKLREPEFLNILKAHDILCVQETHCGPKDIPSHHLKNYNSIPHCRGKSGNNRYFGGMLLLIKKNIRKGVKISNSDNPDILGITLKKEFFNLPEDTLVWFAYASPKNSPYNKGKENVLVKLETAMAAYGDHQIIMGDLNGRTSTEADFIHEEHDAHSPMQDICHYEPDVPLQRNNADLNPTDEHGKLILSMCKNLQVRILNGRTAGDRWGVPTRYPLHRKEKPSVIDYGICSARLLPKLNSFYVLPHTILSDHCCISLSLSTKYHVDTQDPNADLANTKEQTTYPRFQLKFLPLFQQNLSEDNRFDTLRTAIDNISRRTPTQSDIDQLVEGFHKPVMENAAKSFPSKKIQSKNKSLAKIHKPAKWYNDNCTKAKNRLKRASRQLNKNPYDRHCQATWNSGERL